MGCICDKSKAFKVLRVEDKPLNGKAPLFKLSDHEKILITHSWQRLTTHYIEVGVIVFTG